MLGSNLFILPQEIVSLETKISDSLYIYNLNTSQLSVVSTGFILLHSIFPVFSSLIYFLFEYLMFYFEK